MNQEDINSKGRLLGIGEACAVQYCDLLQAPLSLIAPCSWPGLEGGIDHFCIRSALVLITIITVKKKIMMKIMKKKEKKKKKMMMRITVKMLLMIVMMMSPFPVLGTLYDVLDKEFPLFLQGVVQLPLL